MYAGTTFGHRDYRCISENVSGSIDIRRNRGCDAVMTPPHRVPFCLVRLLVPIVVEIMFLKVLIGPRRTSLLFPNSFLFLLQASPSK